MFDNKDGMIYKEVPEDDHTFHYENVILQFHPDEKLLVVSAMPTKNRWKTLSFQNFSGRLWMRKPCRRAFRIAKSEKSIWSDIPPNLIGTTCA